jgi:signal transduction histidine kinase
LVFANDCFLRAVGRKADQVLGHLPNEVLGCAHQSDAQTICDAGLACQFCAVGRPLAECLSSGLAVEGEGRILKSSAVDGDNLADVQLSARPLRIHDQPFVVLVLRDISHEKHRRALERIFFHDILNAAGSLKGLVEVFALDSAGLDTQSLFDDLSMVSTQLVDEIIEQRELSAAEHGEMVVNACAMSVREVISGVVRIVGRHPVAANRQIICDEIPIDLELISDPTILRRIVGNMLKNACEASPRSAEIHLSVAMLASGVSIAVHNHGAIPPDIQAQLFLRSVSTRGANRGIGTYSMKLLTERYLGGTIGFHSDEASGTTFWVNLPAVMHQQS